MTTKISKSGEEKYNSEADTSEFQGKHFIQKFVKHTTSNKM